MSLAEEILKALKQSVTTFSLVPSDGGCFEVRKDDSVIFSKLGSGRFPEDDEVLGILEGRLDPVT